jgi:hypothetical protein
MLMINFDELKIIEIEDFQTIDIILSWNPSFLDEKFNTFIQALQNKIKEELDKHLFKKPVLFRFVTRFDNNDLDLITDNLINEVVRYVIAAPRNRELRLGRPKELENVGMLDGTIMDCINNETHPNIFNIQILNNKDEEFFHLLEREKR